MEKERPRNVPRSPGDSAASLKATSATRPRLRMSRSVRTTTCLQYLQTSDSEEPARNSIDEPQFGQGPVATAMSEAEDRSFSLPTREGSLGRSLAMTVGTEWLVDAHGCRADALRDLAVV